MRPVFYQYKKVWFKNLKDKAMSYIFPNADTRHLIQLAKNSKTLSTLACEENRYRVNHGYIAPSPDEDSGLLINKIDGNVYKHVDVKREKKKLSEKTPEEILKGMHIDTWISSDGYKILSKYETPSQKGYWAKNGVDENDLIKDVTTILGVLNLRNSALESTQGIKTVQDGIVIGKESKIKDLSSLEKVYGLILVEAKDTKEAKERLEELNFHPRVFKGKILSIPSPKDINKDDAPKRRKYY